MQPEKRINAKTQRGKAGVNSTHPNAPRNSVAAFVSQSRSGKSGEVKSVQFVDTTRPSLTPKLCQQRFLCHYRRSHLPVQGSIPDGQGSRSERKDTQLHKPNRCWTMGRVMGDSPGIHGILLGALPAAGGARSIRQAYRQPAAGSPTHAPSCWLRPTGGSRPVP